MSGMFYSFHQMGFFPPSPDDDSTPENKIIKGLMVVGLIALMAFTKA